MAESMKRNVPASMKKYVEPYMQQNITEPGMAGASAGPPGPDHNQHLNVAQDFQASNHFRPPDNQPPQPAVVLAAPQPSAAEPQPGQPAVPVQPYDFIMDADKSAPRSGLPLPIPSLNSTFKRAVFALGGLFVLLLIFTAVKGLFSGTSNSTFLIGVVQDQQEMIHLTSNANTTAASQNLTAASQNFAATTNATLISAQLAIAAALVNTKHNLTPVQLNLKVSQQLDTQLTAAAANGTYEQTFRQAMKAQLNNYMSDLNQAYNKTSGKQGQTLLQNDYAQAKLLLTQLNAPGQ